MILSTVAIDSSSTDSDSIVHTLMIQEFRRGSTLEEERVLRSEEEVRLHQHR